MPKTGKWYHAADALRSVDGLLSHFAENPTGVDESRGAVVPVLRELRKVLLKAKAAKRRFRLCVRV